MAPKAKGKPKTGALPVSGDVNALPRVSEEMTVLALKAEARARGLTTSGSKQVLLERLQCGTIWLSGAREYRYVEAREMMQQEKEQKWLRYEKDRQDVEQKRLEALRQQAEEHHRAKQKRLEEYKSLPEAEQKARQEQKRKQAEMEATRERKEQQEHSESMRKEAEQSRKRQRQEADQECEKKIGKFDKHICELSTANSQPSGAGFTVWSSSGYPPDGFHGYAGDPVKVFDSSWKSTAEANSRAKYLFYHSNPWGLGAMELFQERISESLSGQQKLAHFQVHPDDSEVWTVAVVPDASFAYLDNPRMPRQGQRSGGKQLLNSALGTPTGTDSPQSACSD